MYSSTRAFCTSDKFSLNTKLQNDLKNLFIIYPKDLDLKFFDDINNLEMIEIINGKNIDINDLIVHKNLKNIKIYNSEIDNYKLLNKFKFVEEISLDGSNIENDELEFLRNKKIIVNYSEEFLVD